MKKGGETIIGRIENIRKLKATVKNKMLMRSLLK